MKAKLELAHEYAMLHMMNPQYKNADDLDVISWAWDYADAMQAEAEKRKDTSRPDVLTEWQPDWSQAPNGFNWWAADKWGYYWYNQEPKWINDEWGGYIMNKNNRSATKGAPSFNYSGNWRDSLRKKP